MSDVPLTTGEKFAEYIRENMETLDVTVIGQVNDGEEVRVLVGADEDDRIYIPHDHLDLEEFDYSLLMGSGYESYDRYAYRYSVRAEEDDFRETVNHKLYEAHKHVREALMDSHKCPDMEEAEEEIRDFKHKLDELMKKIKGGEK